MSLAQNIQDFQNELIPTIPPDTFDTLMSELQGLIDSGIADTALKQGDVFPDFILPNASEQPVDSTALTGKGPLVVSFYRGAWCPYCNLEINALQQHLPDIIDAGGALVAISPQTPDKSVDQVKNSQLGFEVLSDIGNKLARQCGLVFTLPESLRPIYSAWEIDIPDHNGDDSFELPIPATYIIGSDGKIQYAFTEMDYTKRLEPELIIEQLRSL